MRPHQGQGCGGVHLCGDVADKTGIGEHEFGVGVFEGHTAHPVAGLKPRGIRAGRHDGADHLGAGPDRTARLQHPDEPDADPDSLRTYEQLSWSRHRYRCFDDLGRAADTEMNLAHLALSNQSTTGLRLGLSSPAASAPFPVTNLNGVEVQHR
jgi:hypothetical protein